MSRFQFVADHQSTFEVKRLCQVVQVARSSFYKWLSAAPTRAARQASDEVLAARIAAVHATDAACGAPRITAELNDGAREQERVNHKRVARVMREHHIAGIRLRRRVRTTVPDPDGQPVPDLLERDFTATAPNTKYVGDIKCRRRHLMSQLIDDHSRFAVGSHVAWGETADAAITVVDKAIAAHGVPQRLLSDNGVALNPSRRGYVGQLVAHVSALGVQAITGKPYKPTTQGKNERFHQTLFRYLDKQPMAATLGELQAQVDEFDRIYNTERPHQGLPGRITPLTAWEATPTADAPRPKPDRPRPQHEHAHEHAHAPSPRPQTLGEDTRVMRLRPNGAIRLRKVTYMVDGQRAGEEVLVIQNGDKILVTDLQGTILIEHTRPAPGINYVGNGRPRGRRPKTLEPSPMS